MSTQKEETLSVFTFSNGWIECPLAERFSVEGFEGIEFFSHPMVRSVEGQIVFDETYWYAAEVTTGYKFGIGGMCREDAVSAGTALLNQVGLKRLKSAMRKAKGEIKGTRVTA